MGGGRERWSGSYGSFVWRVVWVVVMEGGLAEVVVVEVGMVAMEGNHELSMKAPNVRCWVCCCWFRGSSTSRRRRKEDSTWNSRTKLPPKARRRKQILILFSHICRSAITIIYIVDIGEQEPNNSKWKDKKIREYPNSTIFPLFSTT